MNARPELLSPAGGPDALRAAVSNGADAVYLGLGGLNARRGAENFTAESLAEATAYAHLREARVYLTANVLVRPDEMAGALVSVDEAWTAGVDAVIVQDLGLLRLLRSEMPHVRVHASTQMDVMDPETLGVLAGLGVSRVTLAREASLRDISLLADEGRRCGVEVETFVHGALCYCHSGRCLMSSAIGGRSANRGLCAQPCRLPYALVGPDGLEAPVPGRYLLSPRDLAGIEWLPSLVSAGVAALKIEGRMKSPEYVALVTSVYRAALDRAVSQPASSYQVMEREWDVLGEAFSRGFTSAYLEGVSDDGMMSYQRPNNRGVPVGRVGPVRDGVAIELDRALEADDTIEVWTSSGRFAQRVGAMRLGDRDVTAAPAGATVVIRTERKPRTGDRVFRVANAALLTAARRTFAPSRESGPVPATVRVRARLGAPLLVEVTARGHRASAEGRAVEPARTKALTAGEVMEHVGRVGGTPFTIEAWDLEIDAGAGGGFSELHRLRREALERLEAEILSPWSTRRRSSPVPPALPAPRRRRAVELVAVVSEPGLAAACSAAGADRVLVEADEALPTASLPDAVGLRLPRVVAPAELPRLRELLPRDHQVAASSLGTLRLAAGAGSLAEADLGLNALNPYAAALLAESGASLVWASAESSGAVLAELAARSPVPVGALVYGRLELMVADHCVLQAAGACSARCSTCPRRRSPWRLRDAKGYEFPVTTDSAGRAHVYNSVVLDLSRALGEIVDAGVAAVRLDLQTDPAEDALRAVEEFRSALDAIGAGGSPPDRPLVSPSTSGHFYRTLR